jgi:hypothetical protein
VSDFADLPVVQVFPGGTPTDAELAAARDRDHATAVAQWEAGVVVSQPGGDALDTSKVGLPPVRTTNLGGGVSNPPFQRASADHDATKGAESAAAPHPQPNDDEFLGAMQAVVAEWVEANRSDIEAFLARLDNATTDPGLFPAPQPNPLHLTVPCRYCREPRHHPCRHTMLPGRPVTATHQHRIDDAQEVPF